MQYFKLILLSLAIILYSNLLNSQPNKGFERGQIIDSVYCIKSPNQSYSLYLPTKYDSSRKWPIIFIFEPAARGKLPLQNFKAAAEKYGYILIASNNSRNGSMDKIFKAGNVMFEDSFERFSINEKRVYTSGFSGGSRAATAIAVLTKKIAGVIACGAGLPIDYSQHPNKSSDFDYVGIVGNKDFNYQELFRVEKRLNELGIKNKLLLFKAGHIWPPEDIIMQAVEWLELQAMNRNILKENQKFIEYSYSRCLDSAKKESQSGNYYESHRQLKSLINDFDRKHNLKSSNALLSQLESMKEFRKQSKHVEKINNKEDKLSGLYMDSLLAINKGYIVLNQERKSWWRTEAEKLNALLKSNKIENQLLGARLLGTIQANCYQNGWILLSQNSINNALDLYQIWSIVSPENVNAYWNLAKVFALKKDSKNALKNIQKAVKFGMQYKRSLVNEPAFSILNNNKKYKEILRQLN